MKGTANGCSGGSKRANKEGQAMNNKYTFLLGTLLSVFIISGCSGDADDTSDTKTEDSNRLNHEEPYNEAGDEEVDKEAESVEG
jgi:hypothetical protein